MMRRSLAALLTAGVLLVTAGCGNGSSPADDVPALATSLDRVDKAIVAGDYDRARVAVVELTDVATRAERNGDLDADQADRIEAAAEALLAALSEREEPPLEPGPDPASPTSSAPDEDGDDAGDQDGDEEDEEGDEDEASPTTTEPPDRSGKKPKGSKPPKGKKRH